LFRGIFEPGSQPQLIEAHFESDRLLPRRGRKRLGTAMPSVAKRFPSSDVFARATLTEILGEENLTAAQRFSAVEFRSGVFLSQPDHTFRFTPLPRLAQIAPLQGIVAGDFDGDGGADIYALQNSHAPIPSVGRFDGGLSQFLRGDGRGNFAVVPLAASGLVVPGDARALAVFDANGDGWPDFLATRNRDHSMAWRSSAFPERRSLRVTLQGPTGNPTAIGARVTIELRDGRTQTSEVHAGQGCYTQSSPALFFGYAANNPPRAIHVRWPGGLTSTEELAQSSSHLMLTAPAP
jgi:enediyne biosynthesis protein E4